MLIVPLFVYAYTFQIGCFAGAAGVVLAQKNALLYISTGIGANKVAFLMDQRLGLEFGMGENPSLFLRGGGDVSLVMAYNMTSGILFSLFGDVGMRYGHFEIAAGVYKGIKALNYSGQLVDFGKCFPEMEIGYSW